MDAFYLMRSRDIKGEALGSLDYNWKEQALKGRITRPMSEESCAVQCPAGNGGKARGLQREPR